MSGLRIKTLFPDGMRAARSLMLNFSAKFAALPMSSRVWESRRAIPSPSTCQWLGKPLQLSLPAFVSVPFTRSSSLVSRQSPSETTSRIASPVC